MSDNGADIDVEVAGQKVNVKNIKSLNTLLTAATFIALICGGFMLWQVVDAHAKSADKLNDALISTLKELTISQRVTNCLMATPQDQREAKLQSCERIAR